MCGKRLRFHYNGSIFSWTPFIMPSANRNWIKLLAGAAALVIAAIAYFTLSAQQAAPSVTFTGLDGQKFTSESLKGKVVMVNFWATSCVTCI